MPNITRRVAPESNGFQWLQCLDFLGPQAIETSCKPRNKAQKVALGKDQSVESLILEVGVRWKKVDLVATCETGGVAPFPSSRSSQSVGHKLVLVQFVQRAALHMRTMHLYPALHALLNRLQLSC